MTPDEKTIRRKTQLYILLVVIVTASVSLLVNWFESAFR